MEQRSDKGYDISTGTLFKQIFLLEDEQKKAVERHDADTVCRISEIIIKAISEIDRHDKEREDEDPLKSLLDCDSMVRKLPASPLLLDAAINVYGLKNVDGHSADWFLSKFVEKEIAYWKGTPV